MYQPFDSFQPDGRFISVIGSGGKTTLLRYLSGRLDGTVILTTSTHIFPFPDVPLVETGMEETDAARRQIIHAIRSALSRSRVICLGRMLPSGKLSSPSPPVSFEDLSQEADFVLVEADGAAGHPLKAHRPWEPVIPVCSDMTICVTGASGLGQPASLACHCPELFSSLAGISCGQPVDEEHVARVLNRENLADCYIVNQIDTLRDPDRALRLCGLIGKEAFPCSLSALV